MSVMIKITLHEKEKEKEEEAQKRTETKTRRGEWKTELLPCFLGREEDKYEIQGKIQGKGRKSKLPSAS